MLDYPSRNGSHGSSPVADPGITSLINIWSPAATCAEASGSLYIEEPFLTVEVISENSERDDLGLKVRRYVELPTIHEIWLTDSRERWVQIWRRAHDCWIVTLPLRGRSSFASDALGATIELDALYRNSGL